MVEPKFAAGTAKQLQAAIIKCIEENTYVHILTGNPMTGIVTPSIYGLGRFEVSKDGKTIVFKAERYLHRDGRIYDTWGEEKKAILINTSQILKMTEIDSCKLLYQSYECKCKPLEYVETTEYTPYGDKAYRAKFVSEATGVEINVPWGIYAEVFAQYLFGNVHQLNKHTLRLDSKEGECK